MATIRVSALIQNDTTGQTTGKSGVEITTAAENEDSGSYDITTTERNISFPADIGTPGYLYLENMDATNYVQVGFATTVYPLRLVANDVALIPLNTGETDLYLKADTATCRVTYKVLER